MPTLQVPIGSGFQASSTAAAVIAGHDLKGKTIIVTGGYSGIGIETVRAFHSARAKVIVPARDIAKAEENLAGMQDVRLEPMDLLDPGSIDVFAEQRPNEDVPFQSIEAGANRASNRREWLPQLRQQHHQEPPRPR